MHRAIDKQNFRSDFLQITIPVCHDNNFHFCSQAVKITLIYKIFDIRNKQKLIIFMIDAVF